MVRSLACLEGGWSEKARTNVRLVCHGVRLMLAAPTSRVCPATTHRAKSSLPRPTLGLQSHPTSQANNLSRNFAIQPERFANFTFRASPRLMLDKLLSLISVIRAIVKLNFCVSNFVCKYSSHLSTRARKMLLHSLHLHRLRKILEDCT